MTGLIPVTVITGFLGAGKTTLLNRLLHEQHGLKLAIIENEFGAESIDSDMLLQESAEEIVQLNNGCLCCNVRGDLRRALMALATRRTETGAQFDRVVIETSGVADPGPVAQTLFMEPDVAALYRLDSIVTVVDAVHGLSTLDQHAEARAQVGYADQVLLSKTDVAPATGTSAIKQRIASINPEAPVVDVHGAGFDVSALLQVAAPCADTDTRRAGRTGATQPDHVSDVQCVTFVATRPIDGRKLEQFLAAAVEICGNDLFRCKGVLWIEGMDHKLLLQGVQLTMKASAWTLWPEGVARRSKLVMIGRELPAIELKDSLRRCLVDDGSDTQNENASEVVSYRNVGALGTGWLA